ncbi:unnamed protein product [Adineta steineri]|uniref:Uncharacterized protein n=1 Tax=Adineta steineri TaxID=433720 RepID=A0A814BNX6_9BILA|nr:unnamed protein product [Adineta steineri]CAF3792013.1 unnamed protein product [Adineta steineri]
MSYNTSTLCTLCSTQPGGTLCAGCQRTFCFPCLKKHRDGLALELDDLFNRRNELMELINNSLSNLDPCSDEINRWQNEMHANVDRIALEARNNIKKIVSETNQNIRNELEQISQVLQQKQKTESYIEDDLNRIKQQLIKLNLTIRQCNEQTHVDTSNSKNINWDSLLFIIPNRDNQIPTASTAPTPRHSLYNPFQHQPSHTMSIPRQYMPPYTSSHTSTPYLANNHRPVGRSASVSMNSRGLTYTCVCCKTTNVLNENGPNICKVCRSVPPF